MECGIDLSTAGHVTTAIISLVVGFFGGIGVWLFIFNAND